MPTTTKKTTVKEPKAVKEPKVAVAKEPKKEKEVKAAAPAPVAAPAAPKVMTAAQEAALSTGITVPDAPKSIKAAKKQVLNGVVHINISYNNTLIAISDLGGNVIAFSSAGLLGFKGSKKSTPYAANLVAKDAIEKSKRFGLINVRIVVKGVGPARESAIRGIAGTGINVSSIMDATPVPHNGVKSSKPRRI
jgi:small subunit ribosomal protein S11